MSDETVLLAVNGTLMRGLELNPNLLAVGASFVAEASTAPCFVAKERVMTDPSGPASATTLLVVPKSTPMVGAPRAETVEAAVI